MDFGTRDHYRHAVERIARLGRWSETEVAQHAVTLAREAGLASGAPPDARRGHVGFHLIGPGRQALEQAASARLPPLLALQRRARRAPLLLYGGAVGLGTLALAAGPLWQIAGRARLAGVGDCCRSRCCWRWPRASSHWRW